MTIEVEATLHPYQAEARMVRVKVKLPAELTPGPLRVVVSDGATVDRLTTLRTGRAAARSVGLADTVAQLNRVHANDRVYVTLLDHAAQAVLESECAAGGAALDGECAGAVEGQRRRMQLTGESVVEAGSIGGGICGERVAGVEPSGEFDEGYALSGFDKRD